MQDACFRRYGGSCLLVALQFFFMANTALGQMGWGDRSFETTYSYWDNSTWLAPSGINNNWSLGITGDNTDAGVLVRQVSPNSVAARANIIPGDSIVCVGGDQVGRVGNQIFDLREELNQHASSNGRVLMLVHRSSLRQLQPLNVDLQGQQAGLSGTLAITSGRLPSDAIVTVRLENVTRPYQSVRNGETSFRLDGYGVTSVPFHLHYDPAYIFSSDSYRLRATITSGGRIIYDTMQPPLVLTQGHPNSVRLMLSPTSYQPEYGSQVVNVGYTPLDAYRQQIASTYQQYLGRPPTSMEMAAWYHTNDLPYRVQRLPLELMATQEYYNRSGGTQTLWVQRVFTNVIGHSPSPTEMNLWMQRFAELSYSRSALLNQLKMQAPG